MSFTMKRLAFLLSLMLGFVASMFAAPTRATAGTTPAFPLKVSADQRYLVDQNEKPLLVIGDSPWSLIVEPTSAQVDLRCGCGDWRVSQSRCPRNRWLLRGCHEG